MPTQTLKNKYFSFVSDRSKGLLWALDTVFPENYNWFCAVHLARNAEKWGGKEVSKFVFLLSRTFSSRSAAHLMNDIEKISK